MWLTNKLSPTTAIVQDLLLIEHPCRICKHWLTMVCVPWLSISRTGQRLGIWTTWGCSGMFPQRKSFRWQIDSWRSFYSLSSTDCKPSWKERPWIGEGCKLSSLFSSTERDYTVMLQAVLPQLASFPGSSFWSLAVCKNGASTCNNYQLHFCKQSKTGAGAGLGMRLASAGNRLNWK